MAAEIRKPPYTRDAEASRFGQSVPLNPSVWPARPAKSTISCTTWIGCGIRPSGWFHVAADHRASSAAGNTIGSSLGASSLGASMPGATSRGASSPRGV